MRVQFSRIDIEMSVSVPLSLENSNENGKQDVELKSLFSPGIYISQKITKTIITRLFKLNLFLTTQTLKTFHF